MATPFSRSLRSLGTDDVGRGQLALALSLVLLAAWSGWFCLARVTVYRVSVGARLEVDQAAHPVESPIAGRVVRSELTLGREVAPDDVLIEIDTSAEELALAEERARVQAASAQLGGLRGELAAERGARRDDQKVTGAAYEASRASYAEAETAAHLAADEAARMDRLHASGGLADLDYERARAEAARRRASADALHSEVDRRGYARSAHDSDRRARVEGLRRERLALEGQIATGRATIERLQHEIARRRVRAPVAGRLGDVAILPTGAYVHEGQRLCALVPSGRVRVVAELLPSDALGQVRPGQAARVRLDGFPWAQYGSVAATVQTVGSEAQNGRIRVELAVAPDVRSRIPLGHGLPGTVEIAVERMTPAVLAWRAAGQMLTGPAASGAGTAQ